MNSFFEDDKNFKNNEVTLTGENYKHISKVLRMNPGEKISICNKDTNDRFIAKIYQIDSEKVECKIIEKCESNEMKVKITLYQGLPKSDKMEFIIQKSVELGVHSIVPLEMKNCIAKIKDEDKKIKRWQLIAESAAKQSKRNIIPKIEKVQNINEILDELKEYDFVLIANENEKNIKMRDIIKQKENINNIAVIIGPEGGISDDEVNKCIKSGAISISLGKRILRCETAPLVILSMLLYEFE